MKNIFVIAGPTGVGKTKISIKLAKLLNAEIINADSMQIYKGMNIGTAKIKEDEKESINHYLFDIKDTNYDYTIYDYQKDCREAIDKILKKGKKVILVGGSGLYIRAALYDYNFIKEESKNDYSKYSNEELFNMVKDIDNNTDIHINNRKRLERFLDKSSNGIVEDIKSKPLYDFDMIGLTTKRDNLYEIITTMFNLNEINLDNEILITNERHKSLIMNAKDNIRRAIEEMNTNTPQDICSVYIKETLECLGEIVGKNVSEEIINEIFKNFCLGK